LQDSAAKFEKMLSRSALNLCAQGQRGRFCLFTQT
jgi:hypothetical protein